MIKSKLITVLTMLALICPVTFENNAVYAEDIVTTETANVADNIEKTDVAEKSTTVTESLKQNTNIVQRSNFKKPISKRKIVKKFLLAMFGVTISSFLIYFVLTFYNKIRYKIVNNVKTPVGETPLKTPDNMNEAIHIFLEKTQWK